MDRHRLEGNLTRLERELTSYVQAQGIAVNASSDDTCRTIAESLFLAHSTSDQNFKNICASSRLLSPAKLDAAGLKVLKPDAVERVLGTSEFVFLYAGAFSFPSSGCGLFFSTTLEQCHSDTGAATPFDSGGLVNHFHRINMRETALEFFLRHELPLSEHREFLRNCLHSLFAHPFDYVGGLPPSHNGPLGLSGGDGLRRCTHEVRIPNEVIIRSSHLVAVFVPLRLVMQPEIEKLLTWCHQEGFDVETYESDRENDFTKLRTACIQYLRKELS